MHALADYETLSTISSFYSFQAGRSAAWRLEGLHDMYIHRRLVPISNETHVYRPMMMWQRKHNGFHVSASKRRVRVTTDFPRTSLSFEYGLRLELYGC